jgi:hypothetical protein
LRLRAQDAEVIRAHAKKLKPFRVISAGQIRRALPHNGHRGEDAGAIAKIVELGNREADIMRSKPSQVRIQLDQFSWIVKRQRF